MDGYVGKMSPMVIMGSPFNLSGYAPGGPLTEPYLPTSLQVIEGKPRILVVIISAADSAYLSSAFNTAQVSIKADFREGNFLLVI